MRKRMISMLLAIVVLVSLLPMPAVAADSDTRLRSTITKQFDAFAATVYQKDAHNGAVKQMLNHSLTRPKQFLAMDEDDPFTASMFHSAMFRQYVIDALTLGVQNAQAAHFDEILVGSSVLGWHDYSYEYEIVQWEYGEDDPQMINVASTLQTLKQYSGSINQNDKTMFLLVGGAGSHLRISRLTSDLAQTSYRVDITVQDSFDFKNDYDGEIDKGYDVSTSLLITSLGNKMLNPFDWQTKVSFEITVPNNCDHSPNNYRWERSGNGLQSVIGNGWKDNPAKRYVASGGGTTAERAYFIPQCPVPLYHDQPWVVEFSMRGWQRLILASRDWYSYSNCHMLVKDRERVLGAVAYNYKEIAPDTGEEIKYKGRYQYGINYVKKGFDRDAPHVYRLENRVAADGSNMIYLLVDGTELGPMMEYSVYFDATQTVAEEGTVSEALNGMDFTIGYIFNKSISCALDVPLNYLEIYEMGTAPESGIEYYTTEATCTQPAADVWHCTFCDAEAHTPTAPATGHSFGDYVFDNNASCTADGTQSRSCTVCGEKDTVTAPDTAKGHSYTETVTPPTYTQQGYTTYTCTVCGDSYKDDYTDVKQHVYEAVVTEPTCTEQGYTTYTCTECGDTYVDDYTELAEHTPVIDPAVPPTCVSKGLMEGSHCGVCGYVIKKQAAISMVDTHRMEESIVKMPTYDEPGEVAYICKDCGKTDTMEIPPLNKPLPVNPFADVMESDWFYEPVLWAVENNVTGGKTATTFAPNEGCTRAQVVTFLWAANGKPEPKSMDNPFTDVPNDAWYLKPVLWAVEQGITGGTSATTFSPDQECTRAQIATFLWAAKGKHAVNGNSEFVDVADTEWYATPIIWAKENDITGGIGNGMFGPDQTCTRAQVVTFLKKVYG